MPFTASMQREIIGGGGKSRMANWFRGNLSPLHLKYLPLYHALDITVEEKLPFTFFGP